MLENSQDILNIAKTLGVLILSFTLAALFYYLAKTVKEVFQIVKEMQSRIHKLDELIQLAKEKLSHSASYLYLISKGVEKIVSVAKKFSEKKKDKKKEN